MSLSCIPYVEGSPSSWCQVTALPLGVWGVVHKVCFNVALQVCSALHQRYPEFADELTSKLFAIFSPAAALGDFHTLPLQLMPDSSAAITYSHISVMGFGCNHDCDLASADARWLLQMRRRPIWLGGGPPCACSVSCIALACTMNALPYWRSSGQTPLPRIMIWQIRQLLLIAIYAVPLYRAQCSHLQYRPLFVHRRRCCLCEPVCAAAEVAAGCPAYACSSACSPHQAA